MQFQSATFNYLLSKKIKAGIVVMGKMFKFLVMSEA